MFDRLRLKQALSQEIEQITPANGYTFDLAGRVYRGRRYFGSETPLPFASILEPAAVEAPDFSPEGARTAKGTFALMLQGFVPAEDPHPTDGADKLLEEFQLRLAEVREEQVNRNPSRIFGVRGVTDLYFGLGVVRPAEEGITSVPMCWLSVYFSVAWNMFP